MIKKNKFFLSFVIAVMIAMAFVAGIFIGSTMKFRFKQYKNKGSQYITFYSSKKFLGKELNSNEKQVLKMFIAPYEECFRNKLSNDEKKIMKNIQKEVSEMSKNNEKVRFKIKDLKSVQGKENAQKATFKAKRCLRVAYKQLSDSDKKIFKIAILKLPINNVIDIFHGIR